MTSIIALTLSIELVKIKQFKVKKSTIKESFAFTQQRSTKLLSEKDNQQSTFQRITNPSRSLSQKTRSAHKSFSKNVSSQTKIVEEKNFFPTKREHGSKHVSEIHPSKDIYLNHLKGKYPKIKKSSMNADKSSSQFINIQN